MFCPLARSLNVTFKARESAYEDLFAPVLSVGTKVAFSLSINGRAQVHRLFRPLPHLPGTCSGTASRVPAESPCTYRGGDGEAGERKVREEKRKGERGKGERENESDRTKGRGLGACVPTQQYGEFREAAQYPPDRQLIDILPHARHVIRARTVSDTHVMSCRASG